MPALLAGYRVLDLADGRGLLAGRMLADLGADVVLVEPPGGSPARGASPHWTAPDGVERSATWEAFAANRRGVVCDVTTPAGAEQVRALAACADVLLEAAGPGVLDAHGLSFGELSRRAPQLVYASITAFGPTGPRRDDLATDLTVWAAGGPLEPNRDADLPPLRISADQAFLHAAADSAAGVLVALHARRRTGRGQHVQVSAQASLTVATLGRALAAACADAAPDWDPELKPVDQSGSGAGTRRSKWAVADGLVEFHLAMGPAAGRFTNAFFAWMAEEGACPDDLRDWDWTTLPTRLRDGSVTADDHERARAAVAAFLAPRTKDEVTQAALSRRLLSVGISDPVDLAASGQLTARGFFVQVGEGARRVRLPGPYASLPDGSWVHARPAPLPGEHDDEVARDWGPRPPAPSGAGAVHDGALEGLKVVDLSWVVAGPLVGRALADSGATVVRVESSTKVETARLMPPFVGGVPGADRSALYETCNAGKLGLSLDLSQPRAREVLRDLIGWADVVVEAFAPGQLARWGLAPDDLLAVHPGLVVLSTSLMGQTGPLSRLAGFGNLGAALSGYQHLVGWPDRLPIGPFGPYTDYLGPRCALVALLAALDRRADTGEGCHIDVSQAEAGVYFLSPVVLEAEQTGVPAQRRGNAHPDLAPHGVYRCAPAGAERADHVALALVDDRGWPALAHLLGRPDLADDPALATLAGRQDRAAELDAALAAWAAQRTPHQAERELKGAGAAAAAVLPSADLVADGALAAWDHFVRLPHPVHGSVTVEGPRWHLSDTPPRARHAAPVYGADNRYVLRELAGYADEIIDELEAEGVLR